MLQVGFKLGASIGYLVKFVARSNPLGHLGQSVLTVYFEHFFDRVRSGLAILTRFCKTTQRPRPGFGWGGLTRHVWVVLQDETAHTNTTMWAGQSYKAFLGSLTRCDRPGYYYYVHVR